MVTNNVFWHICGLNNWESIVEDQYSSIVKSKLIDNVDNIYISFSGTDPSLIDGLLKKTIKNRLVNYTNKYNDYERACLHSLLEWSKSNNSNILYIHTKGVSHHRNNNVWLWRQLLEKVVIFNYDACVSKLDSYDVIGTNLIDEGKIQQKILDENHCLHFSGNFWWSKTSHISRLPQIRKDIIDLSERKRYWLCERWILSNYPHCKPYEICSTEYKHFYKQKPPPEIELKI